MSPLSGALPPLSRCRIEKLRDLKIAAAAFLTPFRLDQDDDDDSWGFDSTGRAAAPTTSLCSSTAAMPVAAAAFKSSRANSSTASFTSAQRLTSL